MSALNSCLVTSDIPWYKTFFNLARMHDAFFPAQLVCICMHYVNQSLSFCSYPKCVVFTAKHGSSPQWWVGLW